MLAYILAIAVGLGSFALYITAFFFPEIHRKDDIFWSGVGLFYALVLWVCAGRMTGAVLLGQVATVSLLFCFGWETRKLRRAIAHPEKRAELEAFSLLDWLQNKLGGIRPFRKASPQVKTVKPKAVVAPQPQSVVEEAVGKAEETLETLTNAKPEEIVAENLETIAETLETVAENLDTAAQEAIETLKETKVEKPIPKGFSVKKLFGFGKQRSEPQTIAPKKQATIEVQDNVDTEIESSELEEDWDETITPEAVAPPIKEISPMADESIESVIEEAVVEVEVSTEATSEEEADTIMDAFQPLFETLKAEEFSPNGPEPESDILPDTSSESATTEEKPDHHSGF
jgi:hypothetical protein